MAWLRGAGRAIGARLATRCCPRCCPRESRLNGRRAPLADRHTGRDNARHDLAAATPRTARARARRRRAQPSLARHASRAKPAGQRDPGGRVEKFRRLGRITPPVARERNPGNFPEGAVSRRPKAATYEEAVEILTKLAREGDVRAAI